MTWRLDELEKDFPTIAWRVPMPVQWSGGTRYACRICVANYGLKRNSLIQWETEAEAQLHMQKHLLTGIQ
jgi:hypothetical protein